MTSRKRFMQVVKAEKAIFERVLKAVNQKKWNYRPHPKSRTGQALATLIAVEPGMIAVIISKGVLDMGKGSGEPKPIKSVAEMVRTLNKGFDAAIKAADKASEKEWENGVAVMKGSFGEWKDKKGNMAWAFFFDLIHHRGQLSTYLRPMGGKVPSIYGPSGDSK